MNRSQKRAALRASVMACACLAALPAHVLAQSRAHERAIAEAYAAWVETVNEKDIEAWSSYLAPGAIFFPPDSPVLPDRSAILDFYSELFADPQFSLDCRLERVDVAAAEDMAWGHGYCESSFTDTDGRIANGSTKWVKVWKRLPNGEWKCAVNSWNATGPG